MKNIALLLLAAALFFSLETSAQAAFRHVTTAANTAGHITTLDHPQLNGNPNAIVFVASNYNNNGSDAEGTNYLQNAGTWYNGSRWTIFNQDTKAAMPLNMTFNILIAPPNHPNYFTITCTAASKAGLAPNGMVIDHPATNNKPNALLLITQNWAGTYNDNAPIVSYSNGKWYISNNKYLLSPEISAKTTLPIGARFNVMVVENNSVPGFPNAQAFMHTVNPSTVHAEQRHITFLDHPALNRNSDALIWATPNWGWSSGGSGSQTAGPYNDSPIKVWYDHPNDRWNFKNGFWSVYNTDGTPMPDGAKFNVVTIEMNRVQPYAAFKHTATASTISGHETILEHTSLNNKADLILQITPDYREVYNAASTGVRYDGSRWRIFNIDRSPMPPNIRFNVMAERADANHFIHVASAANTGNPNAGVTTIDHPALNDNPSAMLLVVQTPGTGNVYNNSEVAVWYTGKYWNIYNENKSNMPTGASFHVSILSPAAVASVHSSAPGNIWGQVPSATETDYADPQKLLFITHNGTQGDWNPDPCGLYYPPGRTSWSILTGNTARMLERRRFNVLAVNETKAIPTNIVAEGFNPGSQNREVQKITITLPFHTQPQTIGVEVIDGYVIYQGDIVLGTEDDFFERQDGRLIPKQRDDSQQKDAGIPGEQFRWPNGVIPFEIQAGHPDQANILEAIRLVNSRTNLCLRPRTANETNFVEFITRNDCPPNSQCCSSAVGRQGNGRQTITVTRCTVGSIQHEIIHAAGLYHEHTREDRDNFVRILWENILPDQPNFTPRDNFTLQQGTISACAYDYGSIMHYPATAFSTRPNGNPPLFTIEATQPIPQGVRMGQRNGLSDCDIRGVNALYPTAAGCGNPPVGGNSNTVTITPEPLGILCPNRKIRGDAEFGGGPLISCSISLQINGGGTLLDAVVSFTAVETGGDQSTVDQIFRQQIWTPPAGMRITGITSAMTSSCTNFRGPNAGEEVLECHDGAVISLMPITGSLVNLIQVIGDTGSDDISDDDNCGCDTQIRRISFNPITVTLGPR